MNEAYETNWVADVYALPSQLMSSLTSAPADTPHEGTPAERPFGLDEDEVAAAAE